MGVARTTSGVIASTNMKGGGWQAPTWGGDGGDGKSTNRGEGEHASTKATASTDIRGRPNTLRRHPMTSASVVAPLTSWEAASRPPARHRPSAPAQRDPGSSHSDARSAPTVASPYPSSLGNSGADAMGLRCDRRGGFGPAERKASDKAPRTRRERAVERRAQARHGTISWRDRPA